MTRFEFNDMCVYVSYLFLACASMDVLPGKTPIKYKQDPTKPDEIRRLLVFKFVILTSSYLFN